MTMFRILLPTLTFLALARAASGQETTLELAATRVDKAPAIDGVADDPAWKGIAETVIPLFKASDPDMKAEVRLRVCRTQDEIFFLASWEDASKDTRHRPWVWNKEKQKYEELELFEDQFTLAFELAGTFDANMMAPVEGKWDVWTWKSARTDAAGVAMDKWHQTSFTQLKKAKKFMASDGKTTIYLGRYEDEGKSATAKKDAPARQEGDEVAQFVPQKPGGSAADVRAKGAWQDRKWTVEFARKLKTGHADDTAFEPGKRYGMSVAAFDKEVDADHFVAPAMKLVVK